MKMKKAIAALLTATMIFGMTGCGNKTEAPAAKDAGTEVTSDAAEEAAADTANDTASGEAVTIKVFSNLPDRTSGQGLVEQTLFNMYMEENPNVTIEVEALDDEAYKTKFKAYAAGSSMPDLVSVWGQPGFIDEVIDAGVLAELNEVDYADYGFINGSLDGFSKDGKLYGLPRNTDVICFFYNQKMFDDNGWSVPQTYDELLALGEQINAAGIIPVAMDGADKWPLAIYITDAMEKIDGSGVMAKTHDAIANADFSDSTFKQAAEMLKGSADARLFQNGFEVTDYGTAQNLFTNGQAAMFYMGSWEMSMANNQDIPAEIRDNIRVFIMPTVEGGKGKATDISAWNGGGHSVTANAANKEEAIKLLNYMYRPDGWTKIAWENGVCMSAQDFSAYATGNETEVQKQFMDMIAGATNMSGTPINDMGTSDFKTQCEDLTQELSIGAVTADEYLKGLEGACAQ